MVRDQSECIFLGLNLFFGKEIDDTDEVVGWTVPC